MPDTPDAFPPAAEYAWHLPCPRCDAEARQPCDAPRKQGRHDRVNRLLAQGGYPAAPTPEYGFMHKPRVTAGTRHRSRDIHAAPWPEDRVDGTRYDTIDRGEPRPIPARPDQPALVLDPDAVRQRGRALLGASRYEPCATAWPYGLEDGVVRSVRRDPERLARAEDHLAVARPTLVSWAGHYGLKSSRRELCCTCWLTRPTSRTCRTDRTAGGRDCWDGDAYNRGRGWRDHPMTWTTEDGRPAAVTSAPYSHPEDYAAELDALTGRDDRLAWRAGGEGWYGYSTHQVIVWRRDLLGDVDTADGIRAAVQAALGAEAGPALTR